MHKCSHSILPQRSNSKISMFTEQSLKVNFIFTLHCPNFFKCWGFLFNPETDPFSLFWQQICINRLIEINFVIWCHRKQKLQKFPIMVTVLVPLYQLYMSVSLWISSPNIEQSWTQDTTRYGFNLPIIVSQTNPQCSGTPPEDILMCLIVRSMIIDVLGVEIWTLSKIISLLWSEAQFYMHRSPWKNISGNGHASEKNIWNLWL